MPLQASTKQYVDLRVSRTGDSLTGALYLAANPSCAVTSGHKTIRRWSAYGVGLPYSGGTLTGPLTLVGVPTTPFQAATKSYVDANPNSEGVINVKLPPYNAKIDGITDDTAAFKSAYQNATAGATIYVPSGTTVLQQPGTWGIALTKRVRWIVAGTVLPDGTPLAAAIPTGGGPSTFCVAGLCGRQYPIGSHNIPGEFPIYRLCSQPVILHRQSQRRDERHCHIERQGRHDHLQQPRRLRLGRSRSLIWAGTQTPSAATPAQHVGRYIQTVRQASTTGSNGSYLPQPQLLGRLHRIQRRHGPALKCNQRVAHDRDGLVREWSRRCG